ncbi:MAG: tandem-95 repeat protein [Cyanobacteria bacterium P01_D01_bin.1]
MSTQIPTTLKASSKFLDGDTGVQTWDDDVTIKAYSANGSDARISYRKKGGFGILNGSYDNQIDYDARRGASEKLEIDFNGNVRQASFTLGRISSDKGSNKLGIWKAYAADGSLAASGELDYSAATPAGTESYKFAIANSISFERLTIEAAPGSNSLPGNGASFSLEDVSYLRTNTATTSPITAKPNKTLIVSDPITLNANKASTNGKAGYQSWADGVKVAGYNADGSKGVATFGWDGLAIAGGRYDNQIDYDVETGKSEQLAIDFDGTVRNVNVVLGRMEASEWRGLAETGLWQAYDADGNKVASGKLDPTSGKNKGRSTHGFAIASGKDIARLTISATAYGNGASTSRSSNSSDFNLQSITYSRVTAVDSPGPGTPPSKDAPPSNGQPNAVSDTASTKMGQEISIDVLADDSFGADGPAKKQVMVGDAKHGQVSVRKAGTPDNPLDDLIRYVPDDDFIGKDSFTYTIADADGDTSTATVNVTVTGQRSSSPLPIVVSPPPVVDKKPKALDDSFSTAENKSLTLKTAALLNNDELGDTPATIFSVDNNSEKSGKIAANGNGSYLYTPKADFFGEDSFSYGIKDADGDISTATVSVTVTEQAVVIPPPPADKKPIAANDTVSTSEDKSLVIAESTLLKNDNLGDKPTTIISIKNNSIKGGEIISNNNGTYTYIPKANFFGEDSFSYSIKDADGDQSNASVKVNVSSVNDLPRAVGDKAAVNAGKQINIDVLRNDSFGGDGPGGSLTVEKADHGRVSINNKGTSNPGDDVLSYVADADFGGTDTFKYTITDANGDKSSATVEVKVAAPASASPPLNPGSKRIDLSAAASFIKPKQSTHLWGKDVRLSAVGLNGSRANVVYDTQYADHGFGISSPNDRWDQIDFYAKSGNLRDVSEKLKLEFSTSVENVTLTVGMLGFNEGRNGNDETGKWTAYDAKGKKVADGLLGPELSTLGKDVKNKNTYGSYPIEIDTSKPFAELVVEATGFGHGQGSPIGKNYGENNSDFNVMGVSFDPIPNTPGGF